MEPWAVPQQKELDMGIVFQDEVSSASSKLGIVAHWSSLQHEPFEHICTVFNTEKTQGYSKESGSGHIMI